MTNPIISISLNKPILDLTSIVTHPLLEELSLALISFIGIVLFLWLLSNFFAFKKRDFKTAFQISIIVTATSFIIRSISLIFSLTDIQKPIINKFGMVVEIVLLLILVKKIYNQKWLKTIIMWIMAYFGKLMAMGIITLIILFFFTTIPQDITEERLGDKIKIGNFEANQIDDHTFNFKSNISFVTRTENIKMADLKCMIPHALLFSNIENHAIEYRFESFNYRDLDLKVKGSAYFDCSSTCINNKALMNTGSTKGTEIIFIEGGENISINFDFIVTGSDSKLIDCTPIINSEKPEFTTKWYAKLFEINYTPKLIKKN